MWKPEKSVKVWESERAEKCENVGAWESGVMVEKSATFLLLDFSIENKVLLQGVGFCRIKKFTITITLKDNGILL